MLTKQITPINGNILVKKLPDETMTKSGIILPDTQLVNKQVCYVEVIAIPENNPVDYRETVFVKPGDRGIVGRVPYDKYNLDNESEYWFVKQADIIALL